MKLHEFEEMNLKADRSVICFNTKYVNKIMYLNDTGTRSGRVIGLKKYLSADGKKPCSPSFISRQELDISDIYYAKSIILLVKFDSAKPEDLIPLNTFREVNANMAYNY